MIFFHNPSENGYLSNWYLSKFTINGIVYSSMEQYMMHQKALWFKDDGMADRIMQTSDVQKIKAYGRFVSSYDENQWNGIRQIIVYRGLYAKFSQDPRLKGWLLATGKAILAECAVTDRIWGIGLSMSDPDRWMMHQWLGQNLLGYALMMVRERLVTEGMNE